MTRILVVDDEPKLGRLIVEMLEGAGHEVARASGGREALQRVAAGELDVVLTDLRMPDIDGMMVLRETRRLSPHTDVVIMTAYATAQNAVEAMKEGAVDYLQKPFTPDELRLAVHKALARQELLHENQALRERLGSRPDRPQLIGDSEPMQQVHRLIERVAPTDSTVLVVGETGTGKELVAREVHARSPRAAQPLISVDCAAIPAELLESEFFGHEKGAFTGAIRRRKGSFELAHGGTLFLDEIGNMSLDLQGKLLRALQEREIQPIGSERKIAVDVRVVAATNRDLRAAARKGAFREDLYYRLNVVPIALPPLRERADDIPRLVRHFLDKHAGRLNARIETVDADAMLALRAYPWPGNVRELESTIERAMTLADSPVLGAELFGHLVAETREMARRAASRTTRETETGMPPLDQVERDYIMEVLHATRWNRKEASRILGISTVTLWRKINGHGAEDSKA
ncbi:MAG TPA: sigma-54 dependent transcriptional regulator [Methylomirabilota bacterium]|nr:sigma-54 dependent transcriptional regulator [Methylomirabilota bacterium]